LREHRFFDTEDTERLGKVYLRLFFNKVKYQHFVYIKEDKGHVDNTSDSFVSISARELPEVIGIVKRLLRELDSKPSGQLPPFIAKTSDIEDINSVEYWSEPTARATKNLLFRLFSDASCCYYMRILFLPELIAYKHLRGV